MHKRRVVVTGLGVISSIGLGKDAFWKANLEGHSGVRLIESFDTSHYRSKIAGQIRDFNPDNFIEHDIVRKVDRFVHFGLAATKLALDESGLIWAREDRHRIGVIYGSGLGGILFHEEQILRGYEKGTHRLNPLCVPRITPNAVSSQIAIAFGFYGPNLAISNACASGTNAIGEAYRKIQYSEADVIITGGAEAPLTEFTFGAYDVLRALSRRNHAPTTASRPFDAGRDGFVLAEGAATLVLEELTHARARGASIFAEIAGYATGSGAYHMVIPRPEGDDAAYVMKQALGDAGMATTDIGYINAHGTSTVLNDVTETKAIKDVFGAHARAIPISSTKSMLGHSIGAAGALEAVVSCLALTHQIIPPTINYETSDPACDLDYVPNTPRYGAHLAAVLSNSFGFGSNNACLVFKKYVP
ncbi:MAG: beta-ketoacyl-ACP synthase II [Candidatus Omnitrophota bacterium]|nr:beta-ketoacyl-ACP synthase II [Candidatus Omnitrophota bacterium]